MNHFYDDEDEEMAPYDYSNYHFAECCENGDLDSALHALEMNPDIDISWENNLALNYACSEGHLDVIEWLLHAIPFVDIWRGSGIKPYATKIPFVNACTMGNIDVAKYLLAYSEKKEIVPDVRVISFCFDFACKRRISQKDIAIWLQTLNPEKYVIYWNKDGSFNGYKIRTQKEINRERRWERRKYLVWLASKQCPKQLQKTMLYRLPNDVSRYLIKYV